MERALALESGLKKSEDGNMDVSGGEERRDRKFPWQPSAIDPRIPTIPFVAIAEHLDDAVLIADQNHTAQFVNAAFEKRSGYTAAEIVGQNVNLLKSGLVPGHVYRDMWETIMAGRPWRAQLINRRKDGALYEVDLLISPVFDEHGLKWYVGIQRDISESRRVQRASAHMASLGALAAGVVHDLRNPLTTIDGSIQVVEHIVAQMEAGSPELQGEAAKIRKALETAQMGIHALSELIVEITNLVRETPAPPAIVSAAEIVRSARKLSAHFLDGVHVIEQLEAEACIYVSPIDIERVVVNLLDNAAWAAKLSQRSPVVQLTVEATVGNAVQIRVGDNGPGLPPGVSEKIFSSLVTTKPAGKGSGLGLLTVGELTKKNHGEVKVLATGAAGTEFALEFPRAVCNTRD